MRKGIVFGAGGTGHRVYEMVQENTDILFFVDNDKNKWGTKYDGVEVMDPRILINNDTYDVIFLGTLMGLSEVVKQLEEMSIDLRKLDKCYVEMSVTSRNMFIKRLSERMKKENKKASVAEAGVFRGEFAKQINRYFDDSMCYLFDTFEGFDERDYAFEELPSMIEGVDHLKETSEKLVYNKMPNKKNVVIKKGYFPESIGDLETDFLFVNLDMDLYQPTLEGLRYFYPRMVDGGVILIHDYFTEIFPNIEKAVDDFQIEIGKKLCMIPIGDDISMAIVKNN